MFPAIAPVFPAIAPGTVIARRDGLEGLAPAVLGRRAIRAGLGAWPTISAT